MDPTVIPDGGFDVVVAFGSITCAVKMQEEFVQGLKNVRAVLKDGGLLCTLICGRLTQYVIAPDCKEEYQTHYITDKDARKGIADAGLHLEEFEIKELIRIHAVKISRPKNLYCCIARK